MEEMEGVRPDCQESELKADSEDSAARRYSNRDDILRDCWSPEVCGCSIACVMSMSVRLAARGQGEERSLKESVHLE